VKREVHNIANSRRSSEGVVKSSFRISAAQLSLSFHVQISHGDPFIYF